MKHEEIMEMAEKCGFYEWKIKTPQDLLNIIAFAKMVAKREREACAKIVEVEAMQYSEPVWAFEIVNDIRARGENK